MDKQNDDQNTQKCKTTISASDKELTDTENEESKAPEKAKNVADEITTSPEEVRSNGDNDETLVIPETKCEKVQKSNETEAPSKESGDEDADLKKDNKHHSESSDDSCDKDESNVNNNKEEQKLDSDDDDKDNSKVNNNKEEQKLESDDDKENVKSKNNEKDEHTNCESNSETEENSRDLSTSKKRDKLDSSASIDEMVEPLANDDATKEQEQNEDEDEAKELEHDEVTSAVNEDSEGEFEDVEIPEEVDELIVPDEGEDLTNPADDEDHRPENPSNDEEITKDSEPETEEDDASNSKIPEDADTNDGHIESELVAIEESAKDSSSSEEDQTTNEADRVSNNAANDPLNCLETSQHSGHDTNNSEIAQPEDDTNSDANQEDDDDVEFVETRNSPICIESDEEDSTETKTCGDKQTITLPSATIIIPKNLIVTRTSARKSTSRPYPAASSPQTVPHSSGKGKSFSYLDKATTYRLSFPPTLTITPHQVVDTIEVLDSSDEDSLPAKSRSSTHNLRTPPKRTLMAAKGVNNKVPNKASLSTRGSMPNHFPTPIKQQPRKQAPPPLPPPTPQSNFLTNVQLQPATSGSNPPAFSALLSNKSVIIPNAFYGNPPSVRGNPADAEIERRYVRWLENFITQFCNPQLVTSHYCFVLLQLALKYKDFIRIKATRTKLNVNAEKATDHLNHQLMLDLRAIFVKSAKEITPQGRRFCELACSALENKTVALLIHASTGKIILKTCNMEVPLSSASSPSTSNSTNSSTAARKRQLDEDEYVPVKNKIKSSKPLVTYISEKGEDDDEGRKRSLRSKRSRRLDNSFSYNEDDLAEYDIDDEEEAERSAQAEIQRKIEQKRMEAQTQRQQQAKSFESAFIQAFAKSIDGKDLNKSKQAEGTIKTGQRARFNSSLSSASVQQHLANNDAEDLLQATWIENVENEDTHIISDDEEPKQHRIYKQMQLQKQHQLQMQLHRSTPKHLSSSIRKENYLQQQQLFADARHWPKNTDVHLHAMSKNKDICVICKLNVQRIVHHYVNEHRGCEVYNSRLTSSQIEHLRRGASNIFNVTLYKNGQPQYEAHCIFCQKLSRFMLPYWIHHFTMHTGEYAYRCSGCGVRKPTRSLLTQHHSQGCTQSGTVLQDYTHDTKKIRVEARICTLCNYVQLHRCNIVKHLHQQHGIKQILPKHIQTIVLLKLDAATDTPVPSAWTAQRSEVAERRRQHQSFASSSSSDNTYVIDDDDDDTLLFGDTIQPQQEQQQQQPQVDENAQNYSYNYIPPYMMNNNTNNIVWENNDPGEDLSYMICGMLDVQMNKE